MLKRDVSDWFHLWYLNLYNVTDYLLLLIIDYSARHLLADGYRVVFMLLTDSCSGVT